MPPFASATFSHLLLRPGVQFRQLLPSRTNLQLLQRPLPLHRQHWGGMTVLGKLGLGRYCRTSEKLGPPAVLKYVRRQKKVPPFDLFNGRPFKKNGRRTGIER